MATKPKPVYYILHGEDDLAREEAVAQFLDNMNAEPNGTFNIDQFEGENTSVADVLGAVKSFPFLADRRLVIVRGLLTHLTRKGAGETGKAALARLKDELPNLPDHARLVFVERGALRENSALVKLAASDERGFVKKYEAPKDTSGWILQRARDTYHADIEPQAAYALASVTGSDLRRADNELLKLVAYVNGERPIVESDVERLTPYLAEANVFKMVDALTAGDGKTALELAHRIIKENPRDDGEVFRLLALITRQFRLLLLVREYLDEGGSPHKNSVAEALGIKPYPAEKLLKQARAFSIDELESIYRRLQQDDYHIKTGRIKPRLALELLLISLARRA